MSEITLQTLALRPFVGVRREVPTADLGAFFAEALPSTMRWLTERGIAPASPPMALWCAMDMEAGVADCHAGCFVAEPVEGDGAITAGATPGGEALVVMHTGPYDTVGQSWRAVYARAAQLGRTPGPGWELYVDDPEDTPASELRTQIHLPLVD